MPEIIDHRRPFRAGSAGSLVLTTLALVVALAGCGGGSPKSTASVSGTSPVALARCMRANGVPNFPDPSPGGGFDLQAATGLNPRAPAFRAARSRCHTGEPVGGRLSPGAQTHPSPNTLAKLLRVARCMRQRGIQEFPDPGTSTPSNPAAPGIGEVTDFNGAILIFPATMNLQAPAYKQALAACGAPPLD